MFLQFSYPQSSWCFSQEICANLARHNRWMLELHMAQLSQLTSIYIFIYIILINISYPLPSIYVYWVVTLKGSSVYFVFCRASVKIVSRSRHIWYARGTACTEQSNRASISSLPQSTRPLAFLCYKDVWIFVHPPPGEEERAAAERKWE